MENVLWQVLVYATIAFVWFEAGRAVEVRKQRQAELDELRKIRLEQDKSDQSDKTEEN